MASWGNNYSAAATGEQACRFFRLSDDCRLVSGACNAAVYDLASAQVFCLDGNGRVILERCCEGIPVQQIAETDGGTVSPDEVLIFLRELVALGLGSYSHTPYDPPSLTQPQGPPHIDKLWLEVTTQCNHRCVHCYADAPVNRHSVNDSLSLAQWKRVLSEAASLEASWVQIIGGEPLLMGKAFIEELLFHARASGFAHTELFTNGSLIDEQWAAIFRHTGTDVAFSIYSGSAVIHDGITGVRGSHKRLLRNIELLSIQGVAVRPGFVVMKENESEEQETTAWLNSRFGDSPGSPDIIRCTPGSRCSRGLHISGTLWRRKLRTTALFNPVSETDFLRRTQGHPCLAGSLCIHHTGEVFPCIMDRVRRLGSVADESLPGIITNAATKSAWCQPLSSISICRDCEFRLACTDCRPEAAGIYAFLYPDAADPFDRKNPCCMYDPYSGVWLEAESLLSRLTENALHASELEPAFFEGRSHMRFPHLEKEESDGNNPQGNTRRQ
jgi:radical SAM protein with 4Fe4S-binding SPASM domain